MYWWNFQFSVLLMKDMYGNLLRELKFWLWDFNGYTPHHMQVSKQNEMFRLQEQVYSQMVTFHVAHFLGKQLVTWPVCFLIANQVIFSRKLFLIYLKVVYSYTRDYNKIWKQEFSRVLSHGLKWGNKMPKLKRSIKT